MRVLDAGCGVGDVSMIAASLVGSKGAVIGVDIDPRSLDWARARTAEAGYSNVTYLESDLTSLTFEEPFDAVIGRFVLMHLKDPAAIIKALAALVRPGGLVAFQESHFDIPHLAEPPPIALWQQWQRWMLGLSAGGETRMGLRLYRVFVDAGLPPPRLHMEVPLFTPADTLGPKVAAEALMSVLPALQKLGIATAEEVEVDTFADRLHQEIASKGAVCGAFGIVSAWSRKQTEGAKGS